MSGPTPGARLGPYEVVAPLGAGGMGEVYRARDTRLGREVAVKVLPASFSRDPERNRRGYVMEIGSGDTSPHPVTPEGVEPVPLHPLSPDGKSFVARDGRSQKAFLYPTGGGEPRPIREIEPGEFTAGWTADGRAVYLSKLARPPVVVTRMELATGKRQAWKELIPADPAGVKTLGYVSFTPEGKSYVYLYARFLSDLYLVEGLK